MLEYAGVLVPLTEGLATTEEQTSVITKFKEVSATCVQLQ